MRVAASPAVKQNVLEMMHRLVSVVPPNVSAERREKEGGAVGLAPHGRDEAVQGWRVGVSQLEVEVP